jgi:hypothetical protein
VPSNSLTNSKKIENWMTLSSKEQLGYLTRLIWDLCSDDRAKILIRLDVDLTKLRIDQVLWLCLKKLVVEERRNMSNIDDKVQDSIKKFLLSSL